MDRCGSRFLLTLALSFVVALTACVGKSSNNGTNGSVVSVTLSPASNVSLDLGATQVFTATARNALGQQVLTGIQFVSSNNASLTIANNGQACAGTWDSLSNPVVCTPGVAGVAQVTATVVGVSSPPTAVYVHQHIDNITVKPIGTPPHQCFSQGETWQYQATAFSNGADITNSVGPLNWSPAVANVFTVNNNVPGLLNNQIQVTAKDPGLTKLVASVSGVSSNPVPFTTCLVQSIMLEVQNTPGSTLSLAAGSSKTIVATVLDTRGNLIVSPPLTWMTSNPEVATVSTSGSVTARQSAATADISASCTPPTCNIGVLPGLPVYSSSGTLPNGQPGFGVIVTNVTQSKTPTFTAWTATTGCGTNFNCSSAMFSVTEGSAPIAATVTLPRTPNSLVMSPNPSVAAAYVGSPQGLMIVNLGASPPTVGNVSPATSPCNVTVCGTVLAVSPDGNRVVVSDTVTQPNQVYIFDNGHATNAPIDLVIPHAVAAAFSPDQLKVFILTNTGSMYIFSTVDTLTSVPVSASATDVAFSADGSFAYVAGTPGAAVSAFSTCSLPGVGSVDLRTAATSAVPLRIFPSASVQITPPFVTQNVLALEPPNIEVLTAQFRQDPIAVENQFTCNPPVVQTFSKVSSFNLGQGDFTPLYMQIVGDGTHAIVVAKNIGAVLVVDVNGGTTSEIPLVNNAVPLAASASADGSQVFVAACEAFQDNDPSKACVTGTVHIVDTRSGGDIQQVPFVNPNTNNSMCSNLDPAAAPCVPDLIAVRPQ